METTERRKEGFNPNLKSESRLSILRSLINYERVRYGNGKVHWKGNDITID